MPNELPSLAELQSTYGAWNPDAYNQAKSNQDLAGMYQQQKLLQEGTNTQKGIQEYNQNEAMNPLLVEQQGLVNTGKNQANQTGALQLQRDYAIQGQRLQQDQVDAIQKMTDSDFKTIQQHGQQLLYSSDPNEQAQGQKIIDASKEAYLIKQEFERKQQLEKMKTDSAERVANIHANATRDAASMRGSGSKQASLADLTKLSPDKSSAGASAILASGINPHTNEPLSDVEQLFLQTLATGAYNNFNAKNAATYGAGIVPQVENGKVVIQNKTPPVVGSTPTQGQTKSGIKFKVLPQ